MKRLLCSLCPLAALLLGLILSQNLQATGTPVFYDSFDVSTAVFDLDFEIGSPRQGGPLIPVTYLANTPANDYHHQLGFGPLLIAGDAAIFAPAPVFAAPTLVSPNYNFKGSVGSEILGKCITFDMDVAAQFGGPGTYINAGISIGSSVPLVMLDSAVPHFGIRFVEDNFSGFGNFVQFYDGSTLVGNLLPNPAGAGQMSVQLDIDDLVDGNPWDGVGSTTIDVYVNAAFVGSYTKGGGGYIDNMLTFSGDRNFVNQGLTTHTVDNLTVYSLPATVVPEPTAALLVCVASCSVLVRRRSI